MHIDEEFQMNKMIKILPNAQNIPIILAQNNQNFRIM